MVTGTGPLHLSKNEGHDAIAVKNAKLVHETPNKEMPLSHTSDPIPLDGSGHDARCETKKLGDPFATPPMVHDDEANAATGSDPGVDDHTLKFPRTKEPSVRTKSAPCRHSKDLFDGAASAGLTKANINEVKAHKNGVETTPIVTEHKPSPTPTNNRGKASLR